MSDLIPDGYSDAEVWLNEPIVQQVVGQFPWKHNLINLRCFVVIDLKMRAFAPEYAGKMNFYLSAVDDLLRREGDVPTVGIILCRTKNDAVAEYALRHVSSPIGVATHLTAELTRSLPASLASGLPTIAELEAEARGVPFPEEDDAEGDSTA